MAAVESTVPPANGGGDEIVDDADEENKVCLLLFPLNHAHRIAGNRTHETESG